MSTTELMRGPCVVCGATNYPLSMGGRDICPACDCGLVPVQCPHCERIFHIKPGRAQGVPFALIDPESAISAAEETL